MLVGMVSRNIVGRCGLPDCQSRLIQIDKDLGGLTQDLFYHNSTAKIIDRANFVGGTEAVNLGYRQCLNCGT